MVLEFMAALLGAVKGSAGASLIAFNDVTTIGVLESLSCEEASNIRQSAIVSLEKTAAECAVISKQYFLKKHSALRAVSGAHQFVLFGLPYGCEWFSGREVSSRPFGGIFISEAMVRLIAYVGGGIFALFVGAQIIEGQFLLGRLLSGIIFPQGL